MKGKLTIFFILTCLVPMFLIGLLTYIAVRNEITLNTTQNLASLAAKQEGRLNLVLQRYREKTINLVNKYELRTTLDNFLKGKSRQDEETIVKLLGETKAELEEILGIKIVDLEGKVLATTDKDEVGKSLADKEYFVKGREADGIFILPEGEQAGTLYFTNRIIVEGKQLGILISAVSSDELVLLVKDYTGLGKTGETVLTKKNEEGNVVYLTPLRFDPEAAFKKEVKASESKQAVILALSKIESVYTNTVDYRQHPVLAATRYIDLADWALVVEMDKSEALESVNKLGFNFVLIFVVVLAFALTAVYYLSNRLLQPIVFLTKGTQKIAAGDLTKRITVSSRDEIGQLASNFNNMTQKLQESYLGLEQKVAQKTKQLAETLKATEEQNIALRDAKQAMFNLLEDARQLEKDLRTERDRASAIVTAMGDAVVVLDGELRVILVNPVAEKMFGLPLREAKGKAWKDMVTERLSGRELPFEERLVVKAVRSGEPSLYGLESDISYRFTDGRELPMAVAIAPLKSEGATGAVIVARDITSSKQVKERIENEVTQRTKELEEKNKALLLAQQQISEGWMQLQREKARLTASINSLTLGFILTDVTGNIIIINPAAERILGLGSDTKHLETVEKLLTSVCDLRGLHEKCRNEKRAVNLPDLLFGAKHLHLYVAPISLFTTKEEYIGTALLIEDITEAKVLERSREEFFSIASHELRTPLTAIRGNTSLIKEFYMDKLADPQLREMIEDVHESSIRLIGIVNDFLDMSRLEQSRIVFKRDVFDIAQAIQEVVREYQVTSSRRKLHIEVAQMPAGNVVADRDRTKQILINLIGNALKFTEEGGITIGAVRGDRVVDVSVTDTGRGIALENQGLLFHKFQQAGESIFTRDVTQGTGLGLYISKLMVEGMGGTIRLVRSEPGKGSTFAFTLPVASPAG